MTFPQKIYLLLKDIINFINYLSLYYEAQKYNDKILLFNKLISTLNNFLDIKIKENLYNELISLTYNFINYNLFITSLYDLLEQYDFVKIYNRIIKNKNINLRHNDELTFVFVLINNWNIDTENLYLMD